LRRWRFWALAVAFYFGVIAINGSLIHVVPLLTDRGLPIAVATAALSASGLAIILGRLVSGYLLDRLFAPYIAIFFLACPMAGIAILCSGAGGAAPVMGTVLLGMSIGAEIDLLSYMISCYFGLRSFGTLHGIMFMGILMGGATGASILGWCFQVRHSYNAGFVLFEALLLISCVLLTRMGPYRFEPRKRRAKATAASATS
jgi:MFS family permease